MYFLLQFSAFFACKKQLNAAIKSPKYLEMFLQTELQVAFLQTGNDTWGFAVCFIFRRKKSGGPRDEVARLYGE
jgi:hypothetical protein